MIKTVALTDPTRKQVLYGVVTVSDLHEPSQRRKSYNGSPSVDGRSSPHDSGTPTCSQTHHKVIEETSRHEIVCRTTSRRVRMKIRPKLFKTTSDTQSLGQTRCPSTMVYFGRGLTPAEVRLTLPPTLLPIRVGTHKTKTSESHLKLSP